VSILAQGTISFQSSQAYCHLSGLFKERNM